MALKSYLNVLYNILITILKEGSDKMAKRVSKYDLVIDQKSGTDFNSLLSWQKQREYLVQSANLEQPVEIGFDWYLQEQYSGLSEEVFAKVVKNFKEQTKCSEVSIWIEKEYGYYDDVNVYFVFSGKRMETDEEFQLRLEGILAVKEKNKQASLKAKRQKEAHELAEYERLKKKFEKV